MGCSVGSRDRRSSRASAASWSRTSSRPAARRSPAIERIREEGLTIAGVVSVLDRLAGGGEAIAAAIGDAPYTPLATIDDVYPDRPDR